MSDYPYLNPRTKGQTDADLYTDVKWDMDADRPVFNNGKPIMVSGLLAVISWAFRALGTVRYEKKAYSANYGNETKNLLGKQWSRETRTAEAKRYVEEALRPNPYISGISDFKAAYDDGCFTIEFMLETVYGNIGLKRTVR